MNTTTITIATEPTEWPNITTTLPTTTIERLITSSSEGSDDSDDPSSSDDDPSTESDKTPKNLRWNYASEVTEIAYEEIDNPTVPLPTFQGNTHKTKTPKEPLKPPIQTDGTSKTTVTTLKGIKIPFNVRSEAAKTTTATLKKSSKPAETISRSTNKTTRSTEKSSPSPVRTHESLKENSKTESTTKFASSHSAGVDDKSSSYADRTEKMPSNLARSGSFHFTTKHAWNWSAKTAPGKIGNITLSWNTRWISATRKSTMTRIGPASRARFRRHLIYKLVQASSSDDPFYAAKKFFAAFYIINKMFIPVG